VPPAPTGELPQPARTVVLFNQNNTDSRTFAESVAADESLLCPLPCSTTETLADYTTFNDEVEHPIKNFLAFQPAVASQATCIIAGLNVPGFFTNAGVAISAVSRLLNMDEDFEYNSLNPLFMNTYRYKSSTEYNIKMVVRLDSNTLEDCQTLYNVSSPVLSNEYYFNIGGALNREDISTLINQGYKIIIDDPEEKISKLYFNSLIRKNFTVGEIFLLSSSVLDSTPQIISSPFLIFNILSGINKRKLIYQQGYGNEVLSCFSNYGEIILPENVLNGYISKDKTVVLNNTYCRKNIEIGDVSELTLRTWIKINRLTETILDFSGASDLNQCWLGVSGGYITFKDDSGFVTNINADEEWHCFTFILKYTDEEEQLLSFYCDGILIGSENYLDHVTGDILNGEFNIGFNSLNSLGEGYDNDIEISYVDLYNIEKDADWVKKDYLTFRQFFN
jgi:hypothetical protein